MKESKYIIQLNDVNNYLPSGIYRLIWYINITYQLTLILITYLRSNKNKRENYNGFISMHA